MHVHLISRVTASFGSGLESDPACLIALEKAFCSCTWFPHALSAIHIGSGAGGLLHCLSLRTLRSSTATFCSTDASANNPFSKGALSFVAGPRKGQLHSRDRTARPVAPLAEASVEGQAALLTAAVALAEQGDSDNGVINPEVPPGTQTTGA